MWSVIGHFFTINWYLFWILSLGWELLELYLPYDFAIETFDNKISDIVVNTIGFWIGLRLRQYPHQI